MGQIMSGTTWRALAARTPKPLGRDILLDPWTGPAPFVPARCYCAGRATDPVG